MIDVLCTARVGGMYYLDPFTGEERGPFQGPNNTRQSLAQRHGKCEYKLIVNMSGKLEWPTGHTRVAIYTGDAKTPDDTLVPAELEYQVGDRVEKLSGDYTFDGWVVSRFQKRVFTTGKLGAVRYVVQNREGILHIFSGTQLTPWNEKLV